MTSSHASTQAPQAMHSYCRPLRMSMPTGQTCTQIVQSMQSPSSSGANFGSGSATSRSKVMVLFACTRLSAADG
jgi:hypothetical protein